MTGIDTICIEIIARCPLRCVHCSANAAPERTEMVSASTYTSLLTQLGSAEEIFLSGGEPFEHPDIMRFIGDARSIARRVVVYSSGIRIDGARHRALSFDEINAARAASITRVDLSLYAAEPQLHDEVTTLPGSFDLTIQTAKRLAEANVAFGFHFVPIGYNGQQLGAVADLAAKMYAQRLHVLALAPQGRGRFLDVRMPRKTLHELSCLRRQKLPFELVMSSEVRQKLGLYEAQRRDLLRPAFLDVRGFLYPGEGERRLATRSASSFLVGASLRQLVDEISSMGCAAVGLT